VTGEGKIPEGGDQKKTGRGEETIIEPPCLASLVEGLKSLFGRSGEKKGAWANLVALGRGGSEEV